MDVKPEIVGLRLKPEAPLGALRGVGPVLEASLARAGLRSVRGLLLCFPRRVRELEEPDRLGDATLGQWVRLVGRVKSSGLRWLPRRRSMVDVRLETDEGEEVQVALFNQPYLKNAYVVGSRRVVEGQLARRGKQWVLRQGRILSDSAVPEGACQLRYGEIEGVSAQRMAALIQQALRRVDFGAWPEPSVPDELAKDVDMPDLAVALRAMHTPASVAEHDEARRRFALVEAVELFRRVEAARQHRLARRGPAVDVGRAADLVERVMPFSWSADQAVAVRALASGLAGNAPMGYLVQGDVGTGKTAVALYAALAVIAAGHQVAFLAPTELLAEQHHESLRGWLAGTDIECALLTSSLPAAERRIVDGAVKSGAARLVFGTHALFSEATSFAQLGLVIIDEQHRFGVDQRMQLVAKGDDPHVLVMTATPIPRTLTLALFGDLDVVTLRERPVGRPVPAVFVAPEQWKRVVATIGRHAARGEQVYVVCPRIGEDGEKGGAVLLHRDLARRFDCRLVHGRMHSAERRETTAAFRAGEFQVLVGTTVLEVGVDVAMATLMVVIGADRLGLATLHQLRGRVGRGSRRGVCILTGERTERVEAVCSTTCGFELAEQDLRLRGSGELLGRRQSGLSDLRALEAHSDLEILARARDAVRRESAE